MLDETSDGEKPGGRIVVRNVENVQQKILLRHKIILAVIFLMSPTSENVKKAWDLSEKATTNMHRLIAAWVERIHLLFVEYTSTKGPQNILATQGR